MNRGTVREVEVYYAPLFPEALKSYLKEQYPILYSLLDYKEGWEKIEAYRSIEGFTKELKYNLEMFKEEQEEVEEKNFIELPDFGEEDYRDMIRLLDAKLDEYKQSIDGEVVPTTDSYFFVIPGGEVPGDFVLMQEGRCVKIDDHSLAFKTEGEKYCKGINLNMEGDWKTNFERELVNNFLDFSLEEGPKKGLKYLSDEFTGLRNGDIERENLLFTINANRDPKTYSNRARVRKRVKEILRRELDAGEEGVLGCLEKGLVESEEFNRSDRKIDANFYIDKILSKRPGDVIEALLPGLRDLEPFNFMKFMEKPDMYDKFSESQYSVQKRLL